MFFLLYRHTDEGVFDDFPKISDHFPKIFQNCSEGQTNASEHFRKFLKIAEDFREDPKMFWSYTNEFNYNLTEKRAISEIIDVFTSEECRYGKYATRFPDVVSCEFYEWCNF